MNTLAATKFSWKPDFDECLARIEAWYEQKVLDRPPVRFSHHNIEYERHRTVQGPWKTPKERWLDVEFQVSAFVESLKGTRFLGETFLVFWHTFFPKWHLPSRPRKGHNKRFPGDGGMFGRQDCFRFFIQKGKNQWLHRPAR